MGDLTPHNRILWFFLACFLLSIFFMGWLLKPFISILILGAVVSGLFHPLCRLIQKHPKIGAPMASLITCLLIFVILFIPMVFFVSSLGQQAFGLYQMAKGAVISEQINSLLNDSQILDKANAYLANFNFKLTGEELKSAATEVIRFVAFYLYDQSKAIATNTLAFVVNFVLMLMVIYFLLIDGQRLIVYLIDLSPLPTDQEQTLIGKFTEMARAVLLVNGISGLIQGGLGGAVFALFGFESAFLWGVIMGLLAFLPIIGIGMVFVPTALYLFLKGRIAASIFFLIFYFLVMAATEYFLKPKLVGQRAKIHPLLVFFAIIGGLKVFGILGIIYGPLIVTAFLTLADIYRGNYQRLVELEDG
jgi:predicted PurR-regulated permease PerM